MTTVQANNFFNVSRAIAERFIQSVVAVDDEMEFDVRPSLLPGDEELLVPDSNELGLGENSPASPVPLLSNSVSNNENKLYYQDLSSEFAEKSIVCSGLKPYPEENKTINAIFKSSITSDITILDWQMEKDGDWGRITSAAIKNIIEDDISNGGKLRLFVIYTAADQSTILHKLVQDLNNQSPIVSDNQIDFNKSELKLCRICIISKQTSEKDLSEEVIKLFTNLTVGILSNAALASITEVRNNTHNILYKFNRNLDPAYLSHVLGLISSPAMREQAHEVAFDYAVDLISEEIKSELQISNNIKNSLSKDVLKIWPHFINPSDHKQKFRIKVGPYEHIFLPNFRLANLITANDDNLATILKNGSFPKNAENSALELFYKLPIQFSVDGDSLNEHCELSVLQCVRRDITTIKDMNVYKPVLKQGVVLYFENDFFICIQPICDSVRLEGDNSFTFLKVGTDNKFTHILRKDSNDYIKLCVDPSSKLICTITFKACTLSKVVKGELIDNKYILKDSRDDSYEWCGEFKQPIYQEIVNAVSASMARVGFDSFEWLRLKKS